MLDYSVKMGQFYFYQNAQEYQNKLLLNHSQLTKGFQLALSVFFRNFTSETSHFNQCFAPLF